MSRDKKVISSMTQSHSIGLRTVATFKDLWLPWPASLWAAWGHCGDGDGPKVDLNGISHLAALRREPAGADIITASARSQRPGACILLTSTRYAFIAQHKDWQQ